jgi:hypothetical protein
VIWPSPKDTIAASLAVTLQVGDKSQSGVRRATLKKKEKEKPWDPLSFHYANNKVTTCAQGGCELFVSLVPSFWHKYQKLVRTDLFSSHHLITIFMN